MGKRADYTEVAASSWRALLPGEPMTAFEVGLRIRRLALILSDHLEQTVARHGIGGLGDYEVMASIRRAGTPLRPGAIAGSLRLTGAGITGRLKRLEAAGFVERTSVATDARGVLVKLTPLGRRRVDSAFAEMQMDRQAILAPLSVAEQRTLADLLHRVLVPLDRLDQSGSP